MLIANRGEIAVRVIRACRELGISPIAVYSDADAAAPHVHAADAAERIGPAPSSESYLSVEAVVDAARRSGAEAIHPGYGFLSENATFARAVEAAGLTFIGPPSETIATLGDKLAARRAADAVGVPIVPGQTVPLAGKAADVAKEIGFPLMLKAAAGGGGRGMRRVDAADDLDGALAAARREAEQAFGDATVYAERLISPARHLEVQLLGDRHGGLAVLGERDCSVQRRHQKLVEESPSPALTDAARSDLADSARRMAGTVQFHNAATVEFLVDAAGNHYFLEMNTRLQVEHGVTEMVTGIDLVAWQIRIAAGAPLTSEVLNAEPRGHAIEVRIYAEDPWAGFRPVAGRVSTWSPPEGPGVRIDAALVEGAELSPYYDPLLAKLVVHAADRPAAVARLRRGLDETLIGGMATDLGFLRWLADHPGFSSGAYDTSIVETDWGDGQPLNDGERGLAALAALIGRRDSRAAPRTSASSADSAWARLARQEAIDRWAIND